MQHAVDARIRRLDRVRERVQEEIRRGTIVIDTEGATTGQVNGLSVLQLGGFAFGRPSRITARIRLGKGEVIDIEREVELSGPIHSKGVLILSGFLGSRFAAQVEEASSGADDAAMAYDDWLEANRAGLRWDAGTSRFVAAESAKP